MRFTKKFLGVLLLLLPLLLTNTANAFSDDEDESAPDVKARVARINVLRGDAQIKRSDSDDWEKAALNLPLVEGDEIVTNASARLEIQFDSRNYLRLSENARLKITTLRDEAVAVSIPQGTLSLRVFEFDKDKTFFEIDAPKTTVAVQKAGLYRIDSGDARSSEIRITVTEDGQARIYSEDNGSTLRNGRSMRVYLDGSYAGEWETSDAARYADDFDSWTLERDAVIAKRLRDAYYDKYYDRDIYGADDLNEHGEWIFTKKYGYVWRPFRNATSVYADWSPYRYGQWRWISPFGWTWVNDEPWGWATYHHGRWIYVDNGWAWTPYAHRRSGRSWWRPALVVISYVGNHICWYPLPYHQNYYNYNHYSYVDRRRYNTTIIRNTTVVVNPTPVPSPSANPNPTPGKVPRSRNPRVNDTLAEIPAGGVVSVPTDRFGAGAKNFRRAPVEIAHAVLTAEESEIRNFRGLPSYKELKNNASDEIRVAPVRETERRARIGATERKIGMPTDKILRQERILENRAPVERSRNGEPVKSGDEARPEQQQRDTGAVKRIRRDENRETGTVPVNGLPVNGVPTRESGTNENGERRVRRQRDAERRENDEQPRPQPPPVYSEPKRQRRERAPVQDNYPRAEPPQTRSEPPAQEAPQQRERRDTQPRENKQRESQPQEKPPAPTKETRREIRKAREETVND